MPGHHSPRSPSSAHRWRMCPAAISECEGLPDTAGEEAIQGTVFHDYAAVCVEFGIDGFGMVGSRMLCEDGAYREFTKEMATKMLNGLDFITSVATAPGAKLYVEKWVDISPWLGPDEGGTSDAFIVNVEQRRIVVFDWKWGAGVPVDPEWNDQGILYALGVWHTYAAQLFEEGGVDPNEIEVMIVIEQPRAPGGGGIWTTQLSTILAEGRQIKKDADATRDPDAPYVPGVKQCQFCAAARLNVCKARTNWILDSFADDDFDDLDARIEARDSIELADRETIDPELRSFILLNRKMIETWLEQLHDAAMLDITHGRPAPGLKRVLGRNPPRAWQDEAKMEVILVERMGEDAYRKKLLSPAMVEEEVGKPQYRDKYQRFVTQGDPKATLVPEYDPRPAMATHNEIADEMWDEAEEAESLL